MDTRPKNPRPTLLILPLLLIALGAAMPAAATRFPERVDVAGLDRADGLSLRGSATWRYASMIRVYAAALYLPREATQSRILGEVPRRLEIEYFRRIEADDFARLTRHGIERNVDPAQLRALRDRIESLCRLYEDVRKGDRYAITYVPGRGTELSKNGVVRGRIEGADFAEAFFAIWLGEAPIDRDLKRALLGAS